MIGLIEQGYASPIEMFADRTGASRFAYNLGCTLLPFVRRENPPQQWLLPVTTTPFNK